MWFSSRNAVGGLCTRNCGGIWGEVFRRLTEQRESRIEEGHLLPDHVHMMMAIPRGARAAQEVLEAQES